ncbi:MAG: bifunctional phosphoribosylaminoimidazolecarboxamide formyltransferase/IMP cyclohydrolase PurH [Deltaproteobacteria bacterium]|nr:MAG: bifunctional phosphoribosylaminoimidazolecarboxamide formyltransferase/IMP cyclohydrolase PurH [Deltaproteobacteria bacterium]
MIRVRRAIVSVSDKRGLEELGRGLARHGVEVLSTGGTRKALEAAGVPTVAVSDYTGAPEILDGRVKTLHPKIHGGLLARATDAHRAELAAHGIGEIDLVVVNLYPFERTIAAPDVTLEAAVENIDIGGPTMLRAAAKNFERVTVVVDPDDYDRLLAELDRNGGCVGPQLRRELATKAFAHTAGYDGAIAAFLSGGELVSLQLRREFELRYGENPHQQAALYREVKNSLGVTTGRPLLVGAQVLQGKALSYNNLLDLDAALACCLELTGPSAVIVKHTNPCGAASDPRGVAAAYARARECDPVSAFGGIVAVNREVDADLASLLAETFIECVVAPSYAPAARDSLARKKNLRLVAVGDMKVDRPTGWTLRSIAGGVLAQTGDYVTARASEARVVTRRAPTPDEFEALDFAWRVCKHVKSNAILFASGTRTAAVGAGQMSRVDAVQLARMKAQLPLAGTVAASDAFFPFRDGLDAIAEAGATAVIQPGGSIRDEEVIAAADEHGIAMVFTGMRHFRH